MDMLHESLVLVKRMVLVIGSVQIVGELSGVKMVSLESCTEIVKSTIVLLLAHPIFDQKINSLVI